MHVYYYIVVLFVSFFKRKTKFGEKKLNKNYSWPRGIWNKWPSIWTLV
jgi:hypothetical protein